MVITAVFIKAFPGVLNGTYTTKIQIIGPSQTKYTSINIVLMSLYDFNVTTYMILQQDKKSQSKSRNKQYENDEEFHKGIENIDKHHHIDAKYGKFPYK